MTGFAGFGAGSVNLALSSSLFAAGSWNPERVVAGVLAVLWGAALLAGAVVFLARERPTDGRWARYALAAAAVVHLAAIAFPTAVMSGLGLTHLSALLLTLMVIASLGWLRRAQASLDRVSLDQVSQDSVRQIGLRQQPAGGSAGVRPGRLLLAAFAGAVLVAAITTPGLAASAAGQYAVPHGGHGNLGPGGHHH